VIRCVLVRAEALDSGTSAVSAEPPRLGARLPHDRLTYSFRLARPTSVATAAGIDQRSHLVIRASRGDQRPANAAYPECAKLPSVHRAYEFFYGFSPGHGEEARSVMR
jgi:hypothetical protein